MAESVSARYNLMLNVLHTLGLSLDLVTTEAPQQPAITCKGTLDANSTPAATKAWYDTRGLTAGADSIDLTALAWPASNTAENFDGKRVNLLLVQAATTNTAGILFKAHASNGWYPTNGASDQETLAAGMTKLIYCPANGQLVSSTVKVLAATSSDVDAIYSIIMVAG